MHDARFLFVGAGATGGYFGGRLARAGRDVTFLVRSARAEQLRAGGLQIVDPRGETTTLAPKLVLREELAGAYDVVLLGLKAYALESALHDFAPAVGADTAILPMLNGMHHLDVLEARFGEHAVLGGVCLVATTLDDAGRIVQLNDVQHLMYGERSGAESDRIRALDRAMHGVPGFTAEISSRIVYDMWQKWVMLASLGCINAAMRGTMAEVQAVPGGTAFALALIDECAAVAAASGYELARDDLARIRGTLTTPGGPATSSMYRDMLGNRPIEADAIVGDLVRRARDAGVATPLIAAAYANLNLYERKRENAPD